MSEQTDNEIPFTPVGPANMLKPGESAIIEIEDDSIVLVHLHAGYFALENRCSHDNGPLGQGRLVGFEIDCPRHGAKFDVRDGAVKSLPAFRPVASFPVRYNEDTDEIEIQYKKPEPQAFEDPRGFNFNFT